MREIVDQVLERLGEGREFALVTLVSERGSTPRAAGAQMLVTADGGSTGTIGGGLLEATMMGQAREVIRARGSRVTSMSLAGRSIEDTEMLCGGRADVLVAYVPPADAALRAVAAGLRAAVDSGRGAWLFSFFAPDPERTEVSYCLLLESGETIGEAPCAAADLRTLVGKIGVHGAATLPDGRQVHLEAVPRPTRAVICGAGHVALALAPVAEAAGFPAIVLDDRPEFANRGRFPAASRVEVISSFDDPFDGIEITEDSYIVVVTRGHQYDFAALLRALQTPARYVGLMSSRSKRKRIDAALAEAGIPATRIASIHSPVGLAIGAETPAELAISIVAEMIKVRAGAE